jgi:hypothetical protein
VKATTNPVIIAVVTPTTAARAYGWRVEALAQPIEPPFDRIEATFLAVEACVHPLRSGRNLLSESRADFAPTLCQPWRRLAWTQRIPCQQAAITRTSPHSAPTSGRVSSVSATIEAPATITITTHLKTACSEMFKGILGSRTAVKTKPG